MKTPAYLKKGSTVALVAPARKVTAAEMAPAISKLQEWGLDVAIGQHLTGSWNQFSGTDTERAADLQQMLDRDDIRAIFCARGGYGLVRIIDRLDFTRFVTDPKWIVGYSDITGLHSHIHTNFGIETLHAVMPIQFGDPQQTTGTFESMRKALFGESLSYTIPSSPLSRPGTARGILTGGNLSLIYGLCGSASDLVTHGKILFLEDLDEYLYHIDRMMFNLKRSGKLSRLAGLILGNMTGIKDNQVPFGKTAEEIIAEAVGEYDYPVCFNFPAGHADDNRALILGRETMLSVGDQIFFKQA
ncbi:MAG: LD-carboxypeptidase [Bacteroidales bacterium]|nr:LD-carboxypeptidase [Lentimicrobiaceae bacterium]MDD5694572.1 LD-carboxypeptidase [Bacteroidales bacterium]